MNSRDILVGAGMGATLAFVLDPQGGGRRRAFARDKVARVSRKTRRGFDVATRDIANRSRGITAAARGRWSQRRVDDATLVDRVRSKLGRASSHPRAIDVKAVDGEVTLYGPTLASELDDVLRTAAMVRGVRCVVNELEPHESAHGVPSLRGEGRMAEPSNHIRQRNWAPATRALVRVAALAATGAAVMAYSTRRAAAA